MFTRIPDQFGPMGPFSGSNLTFLECMTMHFGTLHLPPYSGVLHIPKLHRGITWLSNDTKCKENEFVTREKSSVKLEFPNFF